MNKKPASIKSKLIVPVIGKHVFGNLYDIKDGYLKNIILIKNIVIEAAKIGNMHIIDIMERQFKSQLSNDNGGVSIIALIEESHIAIHTWPESKYATVDVYSCGNDSDPDLAFKYIVYSLKPKSYKVYHANRSLGV